MHSTSKKIILKLHYESNLLFKLFYVLIFLPVFTLSDSTGIISEINITVNMNISKQILNNEFQHKPTETINITSKNNIITIIMRWNYSFQNCTGMFYGLKNLLKINFTNFDSK